MEDKKIENWNEEFQHENEQPTFITGDSFPKKSTLTVTSNGDKAYLRLDGVDYILRSKIEELINKMEQMKEDAITMQLSSLEENQLIYEGRSEVLCELLPRFNELIK